jgi:hypothetical protein
MNNRQIVSLFGTLVIRRSGFLASNRLAADHENDIERGGLLSFRYGREILSNGILPHRLIDIVAQQIPDFFCASGKVGIFHTAKVARPRHINRDNALD